MSSFDKQLSVFNVSGHILQLEFASDAVRNCGQTTVALKSEDGVVVITQKKIHDKLTDPDSIKWQYPITESTAIALTGRLADCMTVRLMAIQYSVEHLQDYGYHIPVDTLVTRIADRFQLNSQYVGVRCFITSVIGYGIDKEKGPLLYHTNPGAVVHGYNAISIGIKQHEATDLLEKAYRENGLCKTIEEATELGLHTLQTAIDAPLIASELEVGLVTVEDPKWRLMDVQAVDALLHEIAEKDL
ncbi:hypothetical protein PCE1_004371 [Barthelona sp. PCE]